MSSYDVLVIGGGPGGYTAAIRASQLGASVALLEKDEVGGVCLNKGCIPTKSLVKSALLLRTAKRAAAFGLEPVGDRVNFAEVMAQKEKVIRRLTDNLNGLLRSNRIQVIRGFGKIVGPQAVRFVDDQGAEGSIEAESIIIATGSKPALPPIPGLDREGVFTSDNAINQSELPPSLIVIGGGPLGVEFAQMFQLLGSKVTIVEMMQQLLPNEDGDIARQLNLSLRRDGVVTFLGAKVNRIEEMGNHQKQVTFDTERGSEKVMGDAVIVAAGRTPNVEGFGLETLGVTMRKGTILVDERMATNIPNVYAVGDVVGGAYAHVASMQGMIAAENATGMSSVYDSRVVPRCIFTSPEVSAVGITERQARESGYKIKVGRFTFTSSGAALTMDESEGFIKVLADSSTKEILGVHIIGPRATELISSAAIAMSLEATVEDFAKVIVPHPTLTEALREAMLAVDKRAIHTM